MPSKFLNHHRTPTMWTAEVQYALVGTHTIHAHSYRTHEATSRARTAHLRQTHTHTLPIYVAVQSSTTATKGQQPLPWGNHSPGLSRTKPVKSSQPEILLQYTHYIKYTHTMRTCTHVTYLRCRQHCLVSNGQTRRPEQPDQGSTVQ